MRPSKVLGVVAAGLFVLIIAVANAGPGTHKLLSGGSLLGPDDLGTPSLSAPRVHSVRAIEQQKADVPVAISSAGAQSGDVQRTNGGVVAAPVVTSGEPASSQTVAAQTVSLNPVSPKPVAPKPDAPKPPAPKPPPPKPVPKPPPPPPDPPTVTPTDGDPPVIVVVVIIYSHHDHAGDDKGHDNGESCDPGGDQKDEHSHDGYRSPDGSSHANGESEPEASDHGPKHDGPEHNGPKHDDPPKTETEHARVDPPGQLLGAGPVGSLLGGGTEK